MRVNLVTSFLGVLSLSDGFLVFGQISLDYLRDGKTVQDVDESGIKKVSKKIKFPNKQFNFQIDQLPKNSNFQILSQNSKK